MPQKLARGLIGAGVFAVSLAVLTATFVQPALLKAPTRKATTLVSVSPATALDPASGAQVPGIFTQKRIVGTHTVRQGNRTVSLGNGSTAVYDDYTESAFVSSDGSITRDLGKTLNTQAFDRSTGAGKPGFTSDTLATTAQLFKFPFGTQKKTYSLWSIKAVKAFPATYVRETKVGGVDVYEFRQIVTPTDLGPLPVVKAIPGALVGEPKTPSIPANQWVEDPEQRYFVEPASGSIVGGSSRSHIWAQTGDGRRVDILQLDNAVPDPTTQAQLIQDAQEAHASVNLLKVIPPVAGVVGLLLLVLGLLRLRLHRLPAGAEEESRQVEPEAPVSRDAVPVRAGVPVAGSRVIDLTKVGSPDTVRLPNGHDPAHRPVTPEVGSGRGIDGDGGREQPRG